MHTLTIKNVTIGEGMPKICVPIVEIDKERIIKQAKTFKNKHVDIVEWRVDFFLDNRDWSKVEDVLEALHEILADIPLLFTFRTKNEGGNQQISKNSYACLLTKAITCRLVDIIDVEVFLGDDDLVKKIIALAHEYQVSVVGSNHSFKETFAKAEIIRRLVYMQGLGVDIPKIALMPHSRQDVLTLLEATAVMSEQYNHTPIVTMSMSEIGMITRLAGHFFGSAITFAADGQTSAPGQMPIEDVYEILKTIDNNITDK